MYNLLDHTLTALSVRHTRAFVYKVYDGDPDRDNMLGLSRMLHLFGVKSDGYMCDGVEQLLSESNPFIASMGREFSLVLSIDKDHVLLDDSKGKRRIGLEEFQKAWTGAVLLLEKKPDAGEPEIKEHIRNEVNENLKLVVLVSSLSMVLILGLYHLTSLYGIGEWMLLILNLLAMLVCGLLIEKQIKGKSSIGDRVCSAFKKKGCSSILDSAVAKPLLSISWSEIGCGFFLTNLLLALSVPEFVSVLAMTCFVSVCVSAWSMTYQAIRKEWCPLCVLVQTCIIIQCVDVLLYGMANVDTLNPAHVWILLVYPIIIMTVHYVVSYAEDYVANKVEMQRMKPIVTDASVFNHLLKQQKHYDVSEEDSSIIIGNPLATNTITVFSNPHCESCAITHRKIFSLLCSTEEFKVVYLFTSFSPELETDSKYLISCYKSRRESFAELLNDWFTLGIVRSDKFIRRSAGYQGDPDVDKEYTKHQLWAINNSIYKTPFILVDGYQLPSYYEIDDLKYIKLNKDPLFQA